MVRMLWTNRKAKFIKTSAIPDYFRRSIKKFLFDHIPFNSHELRVILSPAYASVVTSLTLPRIPVLR